MTFFEHTLNISVATHVSSSYRVCKVKNQCRASQEIIARANASGWLYWLKSNRKLATLWPVQLHYLFNSEILFYTLLYSTPEKSNDQSQISCLFQVKWILGRVVRNVGFSCKSSWIIFNFCGNRYHSCPRYIIPRINEKLPFSFLEATNSSRAAWRAESLKSQNFRKCENFDLISSSWEKARITRIEHIEKNKFEIH